MVRFENEFKSVSIYFYVTHMKDESSVLGPTVFPFHISDLLLDATNNRIHSSRFYKDPFWDRYLLSYLSMTSVRSQKVKFMLYADDMTIYAIIHVSNAFTDLFNTCLWFYGWKHTSLQWAYEHVSLSELNYNRKAVAAALS